MWGGSERGAVSEVMLLVILAVLWRAMQRRAPAEHHIHCRLLYAEPHYAVPNHLSSPLHTTVMININHSATQYSLPCHKTAILHHVRAEDRQTFFGKCLWFSSRVLCTCVNVHYSVCPTWLRLTETIKQKPLPRLKFQKRAHNRHFLFSNTETNGQCTALHIQEARSH